MKRAQLLDIRITLPFLGLRLSGMLEVDRGFAHPAKD